MIATTLLVLTTSILGTPPDSSAARVEAFLTYVAQAPGFDAKAKVFVRETWETRRALHDGASADLSVDEFVVEALAVLSPAFGEALTAMDDGNAAESAQLFEEISASDDPYLSAYARVYRLKSLIEAEKLDDGLELAEALMARRDELERWTESVAEVHYLLGYSYLRDLKYDRARQAMGDFLDEHPAAPERMRTTAAQIRAELDARQTGKIGDVADLMGWSASALGSGRADEKVVGRQEESLELLARLIEEAEQREQQPEPSPDQPSDSNPGAPQNQPQNAPSPASPAQESRLVDGESEMGQLHGMERARPGEAWGNMPPQERDRILQPIRERFPGRYRELIEQYYLQLSKDE